MIYIERHGNYTVFLDTWKVASHSTAVDALWASVPVLVLPQVTPRTCSLFSMWASVPVRVLRQGTSCHLRTLFSLREDAICVMENT